MKITFKQAESSVIGSTQNLIGKELANKLIYLKPKCELVEYDKIDQDVKLNIDDEQEFKLTRGPILRLLVRNGKKLIVAKIDCDAVITGRTEYDKLSDIDDAKWEGLREFKPKIADIFDTNQVDLDTFCNKIVDRLNRNIERQHNNTVSHN